MKGRHTVKQLKVTPYGLLGPRLDLLVGRKAGTFQFDDEVIRSEIVDRYRNTMLGVTGGVGIELYFLPLPLLVEVRQTVDLTASVPESNDSGDTIAGLKNRTW